MRLLTKDEYVELDVGYDPGPIADADHPGVLRSYLRVEENRALLERARRHLAPPPNPSEEPPRVLDIGCGAGGFLLAAGELGMVAEGVEPSTAHSTIARQLLGLRVRNSFFDPRDFVSASYDIVVLSHVIEHIYAPQSFLAGIAQILRTGGVLVIMTPNADSLVARVAGRRWAMLKATDHVTLLSPLGLRYLAEPTTWTPHIETDERDWEGPAALIAAGKDSLLSSTPWRPRRPGCNTPQPPRAPAFYWKPGLGRFRSGLGLLGRPLRLLGRATGRASNVLGFFTRR